MSGPLDRFERVARAVAGEPQADPTPHTTSNDDAEVAHPFDSRNIHPDLPTKVRRLFDNGFLDDSVFAAFKYIEKEVKRAGKISKGSGYSLMMDAFSEDNPKIALTQLSSESEKDEQRGYKFMFAGASAGIRNPRGHEVDTADTPDEALDYLALASLLLRRMDAAGVR